MNLARSLPPAPSALLTKDVYVTTPRGTDELGQGRTTLSAEEFELLVRVDGKLTLSQIRAAMPAMSDAVFTGNWRSLQDRRLVARAVTDPMDQKLQQQLDSFSLTTGGTGEDAAMLSLKRAGFFVEIARAQAVRPVRAATQPITALVVEDEPVLAKFLKTYLSLEGIQVRGAANRAQVDAELRVRPVPDVVLLDVGLPDIDGFDILQRLQEEAAFKAVPTIMLTGKATRECVIRGISGGAAGYVTKPFRADALVRAVRTVLGIPPLAAAGDSWSMTTPNS